MTLYPLNQEDYQLIEAARAQLKKCYWEDHHTVGCAIRCKNGKIYTGVNVDGIHGSCAEFVALGRAKAEGAKDFQTIVAVHEDAPNKLYAPCGNCRQMLVEYAPGILVILNDDQNRPVKVSIEDLLPFAWKSAEKD